MMPFPLAETQDSKGAWSDLFGCCSSCHTVPSEHHSVLRPTYIGERHTPTFGSSPPVPVAAASARGGCDRADWMPRAALGSGPCLGKASRVPHSSEPPQELLVDPPNSSRRAVTPPPTPDGRARAKERARLGRLVTQFMQEAGFGRTCSVIALDDTLSLAGVKRDARYKLSDGADSLVLQVKAEGNDAAGGSPEWEPMGVWPLRTVLGAHRAEESALVQSCLPELSSLLSKGELGLSAVLEFGGGACAGRSPLLLVEESPEHRERFVSGLQILRLYRGAAHRKEVARQGPPAFE